jgi:hypothetical protein
MLASAMHFQARCYALLAQTLLLLDSIDVCSGFAATVKIPAGDLAYNNNEYNNNNDIFNFGVLGGVGGDLDEIDILTEVGLYKPEEEEEEDEHINSNDGQILFHLSDMKQFKNLEIGDLFADNIGEKWDEEKFQRKYNYEPDHLDFLADYLDMTIEEDEEEFGEAELNDDLYDEFVREEGEDELDFWDEGEEKDYRGVQQREKRAGGGALKAFLKILKIKQDRVHKFKGGKGKSYNGKRGGGYKSMGGSGGRQSSRLGYATSRSGRQSSINDVLIRRGATGGRPRVLAKKSTALGLRKQAMRRRRAAANQRAQGEVG